MGTRNGGQDDLSLTGRTDGGLGARLDAWVADARVDAAALARGRERWLLEVAGQEATWAGTLLDLAERGAAVTVRTMASRIHSGTIDVVGTDFVALRMAQGPVTLVSTRAVSVLRTGASQGTVTGNRVGTAELSMADVLRELAADREQVLLVTDRGADVLAGQLRSVGQDVVVLRVDGDPPAPAYLPLATITEVTLSG